MEIHQQWFRSQLINCSALCTRFFACVYAKHVRLTLKLKWYQVISIYDPISMIYDTISRTRAMSIQLCSRPQLKQECNLYVAVRLHHVEKTICTNLLIQTVVKHYSTTQQRVILHLNAH